MTTITVKSKKRDGKGIQGTDEIWYTSFDELPSVDAGAEVELIGYKTKESNGRTFHNITGLKVLKAGTPYQAKSSGGGFKGGGGYKEDPKKQALIVRQNALTNAVALCVAAGKATPDSVIEVMEKFAAAVLGAPEAEVEAKPVAPKAEVAQPEVGYDDSIPF